MGNIWNSLDPFTQKSILYYLAFLVGQLLAILKRADISVRSQTNPTKTRWGYVRINFVPILIRTLIELVLIYLPYRHFDLSSLFLKFGWNIPFAIPQSAFGAGTLGFVSDALLDWLGTLQTFPGSTIEIPQWLKDQIPPLAAMTQKTVVQHTQTDEVTVTKTIEPKAPPAQQEKKDGI